jgi:MoaA/NifB/PqqE/SkfB family radical SAM enzyme
MGCIGFPAHPAWEITERCNLRCVHCHTRAKEDAIRSRTSSKELSTGEGMRPLEQLAHVPESRMMAYTGGEPLVHGDLFELLAHSQALGFANALATNATLIDDTVAQKLRQHGVGIAAVSLDGCDAETHDAIRGTPGAYEAAIEGMRALRRLPGPSPRPRGELYGRRIPPASWTKQLLASARCGPGCRLAPRD